MFEKSLLVTLLIWFLFFILAFCFSSEDPDEAQIRPTRRRTLRR